MTFEFSKYHGAGNDFVLIDNRQLSFPAASVETVKTLCDRHFGIGADGLMLLEPSTKADFKMVYFNADGRPSSMCGNGARCIALFANEKGVDKKSGTFEAYDGIHTFEITEPKRKVKVSMQNVNAIKATGNVLLVDTGSPHVVVPTENVTAVDAFTEGRKIRYSDAYANEGVNVNFVAFNNDHIDIRTYERGVEDETLACGTGCVAAAIWAAVESKSKNGKQTYGLETRGGRVTVSFERTNEHEFQNIFLEGPAVKVFEGRVTV